MSAEPQIDDLPALLLATALDPERQIAQWLCATDPANAAKWIVARERKAKAFERIAAAFNDVHMRLAPALRLSLASGVYRAVRVEIEAMKGGE